MRAFGKALRLCRVLSALVPMMLAVAPVSAQRPAGTITGIASDPSGAVLAGARVTVLNRATGFTVQLTTSQGGAYAALGLLPGQYEVRVEAIGFRPAVSEITVEVGRVVTADVRLQIGTTAEVVTVREEEIRVNPLQSSLEGVVTRDLIRDLPLNGRNLLDLGQLEPSAQLNAAEWTTRPGYVRLAMAGQSGVTTRVTVDGIDVSDENFGSVALNLSQEAIQEFQVSRSNFDPATGLTGSAAVNAVTRSGSNALHGSAFLFWRDDALAARIGQAPVPFDREQYGFNLGGPLARDRLFWFAALEQSDQDAVATTNFPDFPQFNGTWPLPYDERRALARLDWSARPGARLFARFLHHWSDAVAGVGGLALTPSATVNQTNQTGIGFEGAHGGFLHSVRFGYTNYDNISDAAPDRIPGLPLVRDQRGRPITVSFSTGGAIGYFGNGPTRRYQDNVELRYDGSATRGRHLVRWGTLVNLIRLNWFAAVTAHAPSFALRTNPSDIATCAATGRRYDVFCYSVQGAGIGNGLGYLTEVPSHGLPYGGILNNRFHWYVADNWRLTPRLAVNLGLRWAYEPGPDNPDLSKPADYLDGFLPGLGAPSRRDKNNFAPQLGLAWDPTGSGKWVVRAGVGVFYDVNLLKHVIFERNNLLPLGITNENLNLYNRSAVDPLTDALIFDVRNEIRNNPECGTTAPFPGSCQLGATGFIDAVWSGFQGFQEAYQVAFDRFPSGPTRAERNRGAQTFGPRYATPYSVHFNLGFQRELRPGLVLSVDYVRNRSLKYVVRRDLNRVGAADTLRPDRALAAMNATFSSFRVGGVLCSNTAVYPTLSARVECTIAAGATIASYVSRGLASGNARATPTGTVPSSSAFPGMNEEYNQVTLFGTDGIATYDALHVNLRGRLPNLGRWVTDTNVVGSYAWGRLEGIGGEDQAVIDLGDHLFNDHPRSFRGPMNLDRTHMLTMSSTFTVPGGVRLSSIWRAFSALPQTLFVPEVGGTVGRGEIFFTDFDGDGFGGDPLPGSKRGAYGRSLGCGGRAINRAIDAYNSTQAGELTPAGDALVDAGLFTAAQLKALGAKSPTLQRAPEGQLCLDPFLTTDVRISRAFKLGERFTVEPGLEWFNIFNIANHDLPGSKLSGTLSGTVGSLNGTPAGSNPFRAEGAGSFALGAARSWQLVVRVSF